jgi:hypothetical protein
MFAVTSNNQQGGVTAGQIVNAIVPTAKLSTVILSSNEPDYSNEPNKDFLYKTQARVTIDSPVSIPEMYVRVAVASLVSMSVIPEPSGRTAVGMFWQAQQGRGQQMIQNAFGSYLVTVVSKQAETVIIDEQCNGIECELF